MRFLRPTAGIAAGVAGVLLACSPDSVAGPSARPLASVAAAAAVPRLVITEIMADPTAVTDANGEWFEIYNACPAAVTLPSLRVVSAAGSATESFNISTSITIPGNGFVVIGNNGNTATNGNVAYAASYGTAVMLNNSNTDWLAIKLADGTTLDSVAWVNRAVSPLPTGSPPTAATRYVLNVANDNSYMLGTGANWATTPTGTTFGAGDRGTPNGPTAGATYGTLAGCESVEVGPVATVTVTPETARIVIGRTRDFDAAGKDANGNPSPTTFAFASSNTDVLTVDPSTGVATGVTEGTATVTATSANGTVGGASVTVTATPDAAAITLTENAVQLRGYTFPVFFTVRDADGNAISPAPALTWSSLNEARATVDQRGYVYMKEPGAVSVRATAPNGVFGQLNVTVLDTVQPPADHVYRDHLEFGTPTDATPADEHVLGKRQFVTSWNAARGGPNWVSWSLHATNFIGSGRCDCFTSDPTLPPVANPIHDSDYRGSGYDRGHMVQSDSRTRTFTENAATYLLTNILPQAGENNQGPWQAFEQFLNAKAETGGKDVYVVAGGIFAAAPPTLKNEGRVAIPDYTWKVAIVVPTGVDVGDVDSPDDLEMYAVKMPNLVTPGVPASAVGIRTTPWRTYETTVDAIEAETGYDVFALLADPLEAILESKDRFPVASAGGPYAGVEGSAIELSAAGSSDPDGDALTFEWDLDNDGAFDDATGATADRVFGDEGAFLVRVRATDPKGAASVATAPVTVANADPAVRLALDAAAVTSGQLAWITGTFTDAGAGDAPWQWTLDWGASVSTGSLADRATAVRESRRMCVDGAFEARFTVRDVDGGSGSAAATVTVLPRAVAVALPGALNAKGKGAGTLPVTVLSQDGFDATTLDAASVTLGRGARVARRPNGTLMAAAEDVDGDGDLDLVLHFGRADVLATLDSTSSQATLVLRGGLTDGCTRVAGAGPVRVLR